MTDCMHMHHLRGHCDKTPAHTINVQSLKTSMGESQVVDTIRGLYMSITETRLVKTIMHNRDMMLLQQFLPCQISSKFFTFQQDSAPAHRALKAINFSPITLPNVELSLKFFPNTLNS